MLITVTQLDAVNQEGVLASEAVKRSRRAYIRRLPSCRCDSAEFRACDHRTSALFRASHLDVNFLDATGIRGGPT